MRSSAAILAALLVVIVLLVAYTVAKDPVWARKSYWLANFVESPWQLYRRSDGTFDEAARLALRRAAGRRDPAPLDHLLSATIITRNVLGQAHRPEVDRAGVLTRAALAASRERRALFGQARTHYMQALEGLRRPAATPVGLAAATRIVDAALGFAYGGVDDLVANDPVLARMLAEDWGVDEWQDAGPGFWAGGVDRPLATAAIGRHEDVVRSRQQAAQEVAREQGGARGAAADAYVELATQHTDDPQNVHDSGVLACLKGIVDRLRADQGDSERLPQTASVIADLQAGGMARYSRATPDSPPRPDLVADAVAVARRTTDGDRIASLDVTDEECLRRVWARAGDPRNARVRGQMRQALFDSLVDSWEEGIAGRKIVCVNGRTSRILGALVLLDWDQRNWEVKKLEQFKNDVFGAARGVIEQAALRAAESEDPELRKAGRAYLAKTAAEIREIGPVDDQVSARLAAAMRAEIAEMIDRYVAALGVKDAIPPYLLDRVREEAQAAVVD